MTALEKIGPSPTRLGGTRCTTGITWSRKDRAHRTDLHRSGDLRGQMTHIFGGTWT